MSAQVEINFDGIVGPSHNYAGLSIGNLAASRHAGTVSYPRAAALQGLAKMRHNLDAGLAQGWFMPLDRPDTGWLAGPLAAFATAPAAIPRRAPRPPLPRPSPTGMGEGVGL